MIYVTPTNLFMLIHEMLIGYVNYNNYNIINYQLLLHIIFAIVSR